MTIKTLTVGALHTNCYIVDIGDKTVVIDPGADIEKILSHVSDKNVIYIMITHGHFDHITAVNELKEKTNALVVAPFLDKELLSDPSLNSPFIRRGCIVKADIYLNDNDKITVNDVDFTYISTPGHTIGSSCIIAQNNIFSGDFLFYLDIGRTDFYSGDFEDMEKSLKRISMLENDYNIYPGHGEKTTLNFEKLYNPYLKKYSV